MNQLHDKRSLNNAAGSTIIGIRTSTPPLPIRLGEMEVAAGGFPMGLNS